MRKFDVKQLTLAAMVAALYTVLSYFGNIFGLTYGPIQCRFAEALCVLPFLFPATVPGLFVGCFLTNLMSTVGPLDLVLGSLATLLAAGKAEIGILPEPHVTSALMQNDSLKAVIDVTAAFKEAAAKAGNPDMELSMGCVIVRRDFAEANPEKVAAFLDAYGASVAMVNSDADAASQLVEKHGVMPKAAVAKRAIPNCHIVFVEGEAVRTQIEPLYEVLLAANPASIGGALPDDGFYYVR